MTKNWREDKAIARVRAAQEAYDNFKREWGTRPLPTNSAKELEWRAINNELSNAISPFIGFSPKYTLPDDMGSGIH